MLLKSLKGWRWEGPRCCFQSGIDNLNSPINRFFDYFIGENPKRIEEMQNKIATLRIELAKLRAEAAGELQLAPEFQSGSFTDAMNVIKAKTKGGGSVDITPTLSDDGNAFEDILKRYDAINKESPTFKDDVFEDDFGQKIGEDNAKAFDDAWSKRLKDLKGKIEDEVIPAGEKLKTVFEDNAAAIGSMIRQGAKFEDILFKILGLAAISFLPELGFGKGTSNFIGGLFGAANGANFTVPGGFPNDSFAMGVTSGEHVKVTPQGQAGNEAKILSSIDGKMGALNENVTRLGARQSKLEAKIALGFDGRDLYVSNKKQQRLESSYQ